jgi:hypothetical protein
MVSVANNIGAWKTMKCDCGFRFETRPGHFRNFNVKLRGDGKWISICPICGSEYEKPDRK